jgi:predicted TIM-barrel enzyme
MRQFARREIHARLRATMDRGERLIVAHGGPFEDPATVARVVATTDVVGYLGASSIERLPVERAVSGVVREFKALRPRASAR